MSALNQTNLSASLNTSCVAIYADINDAEQALKKLQHNKEQGIDNLSIIACVKQAPGSPLRDNASHHQNTLFTGQDANSRNPLSQYFTSSAFVNTTEAGPIIVMGGILKTLIDDSNDKAPKPVNQQKLKKALYNKSIPWKIINEYLNALKEGKVLLLVNGEREYVEQCCDILHSEKQQVTVHHG